MSPDKYYIVPINFAGRDCVAKAKTNQTFGRRVTDLTANGLNGIQKLEDIPVYNLPTFEFIMALLSDKSYFFSFDYKAAYRNIPMDLES